VAPYVAPIWASVLSFEKNRKILRSAPRVVLVRTSTAWGTVSHAALCVVTSIMPIHIKARQREKEYAMKKSLSAISRQDMQRIHEESPTEAGQSNSRSNN
jgi:hypothetical protein